MNGMPFGYTLPDSRPPHQRHIVRDTRMGTNYRKCLLYTFLAQERTGNAMNTANGLQYGQKRQEDLQRLKNFRLLDDDFCTKVFEDIECVELLLRIILKKDNLKVTEVHSQI